MSRLDLAVNLGDPAIESALRSGISALEVADQAVVFAALFECGSREMQAVMLFASVGGRPPSIETKYCVAEALDGSDAASAWLNIEREAYEATLQAALAACS